MATKVVNEITINKIRIGGKAPTKIMKGSSEVKKVTKGSTVVYLKEDVTYTLSASAIGQAGAASTEMRHYIYSYKGSSTPVALRSSNISVTAGGGSVKSVAVHESYPTCYVITLTIPTNSSTSAKTHSIKITQPNSAQTITISGTQEGAGNYYDISIINIYAAGTWPQWGSNCYLYMPTFRLKSTEVAGNFPNLGQGAILSPGSLIERATLTSKIRVMKGDAISMDLYLGGTIIGNSSYNNFTFALNMASTTSSFNAVSSSWVWRTGVQPSPTVTLISYFNTISSINTGFTLNIQLNLTSNNIIL